MIVRTAILGILYLIATQRALRHNVHMFQLNGYKNGEHMAWIGKMGHRQWLLELGCLLGIVRFFFSSPVIDTLCYICLLLTIMVFGAMIRLSGKKKLVYTARVKRLIFTQVLLTALVTLIPCFIKGFEYLSAGFMWAVAVQIFMPVAANTVNRPVEGLVNLYYINDAKRILKKSGDVTVIGVTGSYGKTSVKYYLNTLLMEHFNVLITPESYNTPMGVVKTIRGSMKSTHEIFICEMGARHVGDIKEICDIVHPRHGIITSVGPQHLETFFNMDNILNTKFELADALGKDGILFLNGDNEYIQQKADSYPGAVFYRTGEEGEGYHASDIKLSNMGTDFCVTSPTGEKESFSMYLVGAHNIINVLGAIAVANTLGVPLRSLKAPVRRLRSVAHRMELKEQGEVTVIDDAYNSNPVGSKAAVETLAMFDGVRIIITPGMVELGEKEDEYNRLLGTYAADCCDHILLVGRKRGQVIMDGALSAGFDSGRCRLFDRFEDAYAYALAIKEDGHKYILIENDLPDNY